MLRTARWLKDFRARQTWSEPAGGTSASLKPLQRARMTNPREDHACPICWGSADGVGDRKDGVVSIYRSGMRPVTRALEQSCPRRTDRRHYLFHDRHRRLQGVIAPEEAGLRVKEDRGVRFPAVCRGPQYALNLKANKTEHLVKLELHIKSTTQHNKRLLSATKNITITFNKGLNRVHSQVHLFQEIFPVRAVIIYRLSYGMKGHAKEFQRLLLSLQKHNIKSFFLQLT
ncbi:hypothetical protein NDU88_006988 [Pleurodeles waltl]|uniref:Uncharacterized protein n=1 Tax=Pleurodeles waltl TaxID=8319 RepID=A0AAV7N0V2_PLEWA|nr:hypothetical protein NDU88_006988 [Pleurodeles waltl]